MRSRLLVLPLLLVYCTLAAPQFTPPGVAVPPSALLNERQHEGNGFAILAYEGSVHEVFHYQVAAYDRVSNVHYAPDSIGDLNYTGAAGEVLCLQEERRVGNDNTVKWRGLTLQIPPSPWRTHFVRTIVRRQIAGFIEGMVETRRKQVDIEFGNIIPDEKLNPENSAISKERDSLAASVLKTISARDREILTRFYLQEQSQEQICQEMSLTETQFRLLKSRAKAKFGELGKRKLERKQSGAFH